ncbi:hypothetical protein [Microvirga roseola]|uniref:hypothetical protein n=1 Tax=Microvirga roseola TaxID=2883126 RepID=UPI001E35D295|nr:hypothetical protein [Microvirga roseola]
MLPDGGWLVVWESKEQDGDGRGIYMQRYDRHGVAQYDTGEVKVNQTTAGSQARARVEVLGDGGWVIAWEAGNIPKTIYQRYYDSNGTTVGPDLPVRNAYNGALFSSEASIAETPDGGWVAAWLTQFPDSSHTSIMQRSFTKLAQQVLTTQQEYALGTDADEVLQVGANRLSFGDVVDGGLGNDTLQMIEAGDLDIYSNHIRGFEAIVGSSGDDVIITDSHLLAPVMTIAGGDGEEELQFFDGDQPYDLRGKTITGIERIVLHDVEATLHVDDVSMAPLAFGPGFGEAVRLHGRTFTLDQRLQLFRQGIENVVDDNGTWTNALPELSNINGDQLVVAAGGSGRLDFGGNAIVTEDTGRFTSLLVQIANGVRSQDRLRLHETGQVTISENTVSVDGTAVGTIDADGSGQEGLKINLNANANPARVTELIRALSFEHNTAVNPVTDARDVIITLVDGGGAQNEAVVSVRVSGTGGSGNSAPTIQLAPGTPKGFDNGLISLFAGTAVNDQEGHTLTVRVTLDAENRAKGVLVPQAGFGQYDPETGIFTVTGSAGRVTDALNSLQFNPRDRTGPVGEIETATFRIFVDDGIETTNRTLSVESAIANRPPVVKFTARSLSELAKNDTVAGLLPVTDPNGSEETLTYSLLGAESAPFSLVSRNRSPIQSLLDRRL